MTLDVASRPAQSTQNLCAVIKWAESEPLLAKTLLNALSCWIEVVSLTAVCSELAVS